MKKILFVLLASFFFFLQEKSSIDSPVSIRGKVSSIEYIKRPTNLQEVIDCDKPIETYIWAMWVNERYVVFGRSCTKNQIPKVGDIILGHEINPSVGWYYGLLTPQYRYIDKH